MKNSAGEFDEPILSLYQDLIAEYDDKYYCYLSTTGVYGNHHGAWVDEQSATIPTQTRSQLRLEAEQKWQSLTKNLAKNLVILRLAGIYGEGRNALKKLQTGALKRALVKYYPDGQKQIFSHIHVDDIAHAIKFCLTNRLSGIYNLCDNSPCPPDEVICLCGEIAQSAPTCDC